MRMAYVSSKFTLLWPQSKPHCHHHETLDRAPGFMVRPISLNVNVPSSVHLSVERPDHDNYSAQFVSLKLTIFGDTSLDVDTF